MISEQISPARGGLAPLELELDPGRALRVLLSVSALLAATSLLAAGVDHALGGVLEEPRDVIDLNREGSLPTLWSALQLAGASVLALLGSVDARRRGDRDQRWWTLLGVVFAALALDEALALHEHAIEPIRDALGVGGLLYYAWVVPAGVVLLALGLALRRFVLRLPASTRRLLVVGVATLLTGGYALELVGGLARESGPAWLVVGLYHVEESLELLGEALIILALLRHLAPLRLGVTR